MTDYPFPPPAALRQCVTHLGIAESALRWELLDQALIHSSYSSERNNERLEFLGDSVLRLATAEFLMEKYPDASVGDLTMMRSHLVSDQTLTRIAEQLGLEQFLHVSSAAAGDQAARPKRLADAMEAILAVLYLSKGDLQLVHPWLDPHLEPLARKLMQNPAGHNPKTALQELTQKQYKVLPEYRTAEISMVHGDPERFRSEVWFRDRHLGTGVGASRKAAEQAAASEGYRVMQAMSSSTSSPFS
ncbi:ribonuclease III [Oscillatoria sp. CS-180]|uniref:ribonuclease III n=1 Tax=Oscillatoria sp. CS-180 TaxID=3021720 RepID=UPI00232DB124|nr:ribonuclease III [Oscillatoria sp. CS-180]MDB9528423.1 ribonuclease III [Oscillatoria sp. CS-180]